MHYREGTLGYQMRIHQNTYGFDADQAAQQYSGPLPSASILLPYYNAGKTINAVVHHLLHAITVVTRTCPDWRYEVILIDDGSEIHPVKQFLTAQQKEHMRIETIAHQGRCFARNYALALARNRVVIFIDADVLISSSLLLRHLSLHAVCEQQKKGCISFALFDFHPLPSLSRSATLFDQPAPNDWRLGCVYQEAWHGCQQDKRFAGTRFQPLADTAMLQQWPEDGFYGPWVLPNMVLGGFFTVNREKALAVGGCDPLFNTYAFEETSLVTRLVACYHEYVIPLIEHFALHIEDDSIGENREMKYRLFRQAHQRYFQEFLVRTHEQC